MQSAYKVLASLNSQGCANRSTRSTGKTIHEHEHYHGHKILSQMEMGHSKALKLISILHLVGCMPRLVSTK